MELLKKTISFEEFLDLDGPLEWVNGEVVPLTAVDLRHDELSGWLSAVLRYYVSLRDLGSVHQEPFVMKLGPDLPGRSPDLCFVSAANRHRLDARYLNGPADVCVEVISPGSQSRDRGDKFYEYEAGGVIEYWLIDPIRKQAEFYFLTEGLYVAQPLQEGIFRSQAIPGFWIREPWLWADPRPKLHLVLRELIGEQ